MNGEDRFDMRNWEFPDPESNDSAHPSPFMKMSAYTDENILIHESNSGVTSMDFSWVPNGNYQSSVSHLQAAQVSSQMIETPNATSAPENTQKNSDHGTIPTKVTRQQCSVKGQSSIASKTLSPKELNKHTSSAGKKMGSSRLTGSREKMIRTAEKLEKMNRNAGKRVKVNPTAEKHEKVNRTTEKHDEVNQDHIVEEEALDFSGVPAPVCSCTGVPRQCYRWGSGAWQSSCCTTSLSAYPLPMSTSKIGSRVAGRKMTIGAYEKLLRRLAAQGQNLSYAVDLKDHWARHGTNKFVIIK